jgi:hypothetical protein
MWSAHHVEILGMLIYSYIHTHIYIMANEIWQMLGLIGSWHYPVLHDSHEYWPVNFCACTWLSSKTKTVWSLFAGCHLCVQHFHCLWEWHGKMRALWVIQQLTFLELRWLNFCLCRQISVTYFYITHMVFFYFMWSRMYQFHAIRH